MTGRRRRGGGSHGSSGSRTTRRDGGSDTTRRDGAPGDGPGGHGVGANVDAIDTMAGRLDATRTRVDGVGTTVRAVNVGPQSMGVIGSGFTGAAQAHLRTTEQHVTRTTQAIDKAQAGTRGTAQAYRTTDATSATNLAKFDTKSTVPASTRPDGGRPPSTPPAPDPIIANRLNPPASTPTPTPAHHHQPSPRETALQNKKVTKVTELDPGNHANDAFKATFEDGSHGVYKPTAGADGSLRNSIPAEGMAHREVATYRLDEQLGFGLVPTTTAVDGHRGPGSMQEWADSTPGRPPGHYPAHQQEQMAVLDYITGNTDRHGKNYLTGADGSPVAIDHGYSFPEAPTDAIRSDFVVQHLNAPLGDDVLDRVRAMDPEQVRGMLTATGLNDSAVDGAVARLREIQTHGMITGDAWRGPIVHADWRVARGPLS
jgi:uncharacterized protein YukE